MVTGEAGLGLRGVAGVSSPGAVISAGLGGACSSSLPSPPRGVRRPGPWGCTVWLTSAALELLQLLRTSCSSWDGSTPPPSSGGRPPPCSPPPAGRIPAMNVGQGEGTLGQGVMLWVLQESPSLLDTSARGEQWGGKQHFPPQQPDKEAVGAGQGPGAFHPLQLTGLSRPLCSGEGAAACTPARAGRSWVGWGSCRVNVTEQWYPAPPYPRASTKGPMQLRSQWWDSNSCLQGPSDLSLRLLVGTHLR